MADNISLPANWRWATLGEVSENQYGYTAKAEKNNSLPKMLRITDIQNGIVDWENVPNCQINDEQREKYLLNNNDIVIARTGATTGKSYIVKNPINSVFASYLIRLRVSKKVDAKYIYLFLQSDFYWLQISELAAGIAQPGVNSTKLQNIKFPLPPLDEQKRIVTLLDSFFEKLDAAKEVAKAVIDSYEFRRASILHKAFTGELSEKWRVENGFSLDEWQEKTLGEITKNQYGYTAKAMKDNSFPKMLRITDIQNGIVDWENVPNCQINDEQKEKYLLEDNDIVIARTGATTGKSYIVKNPVNSVFASYLIRLRVSPKVDAKYIYLFLQSDFYWLQISELAAGIAQPGVNSTKLKNIQIFIPHLKEQKEIVRLLDSLLGKEQRTKEIDEKVLQQIDTLKKNILARAFRGELGTN